MGLIVGLTEWIMARIHVVMPDETLRAIDAQVGKRGRSRFLEEAAREKLARNDFEEVLRATHGIAKGKGYEHWKDAETTEAWVRWMRGNGEPRGDW